MENENKGNSYIRQGCFSSSEYELAENYFLKAAEEYKKNKQYSSYEIVIKKAVSCQLKLGMEKRAALTLSSCANELLRNNYNLNIISKMIEESAFLLLNEGQILDTFNIYLTMANKISDSTIKINFLTNAINILEGNTEYDVYIVEAYRKLINEYFKIKEIKKVIELYEDLLKVFISLNQQHNINKVILSIIIIYLSQNDIINAELFHNKYNDSYVGSDEFDTTMQLFDAIKTNKDIKMVLNNSLSVKYLDNQVCLLIKSIMTDNISYLL